jgi:hypothetical protein
LRQKSETSWNGFGCGSMTENGAVMDIF